MGFLGPRKRAIFGYFWSFLGFLEFWGFWAVFWNLGSWDHFLEGRGYFLNLGVGFWNLGLGF